jgi:hypothetical protein
MAMATIVLSQKCERLTATIAHPRPQQPVWQIASRKSDFGCNTEKAVQRLSETMAKLSHSRSL